MLNKNEKFPYTIIKGEKLPKDKVFFAIGVPSTRWKNGKRIGEKNKDIDTSKFGSYGIGKLNNDYKQSY